jgi:hypothetical protein
MRPAAAGSGWLGFVHGSRVLAVATATDEFVQSAWKALLGDDAFQEILNLLTRHGLASTPDFVLVEWQDDAAADATDLRCIVRGAPALEVTDATGTTTLSAAGIATWAERNLSSVTALDLTILGLAAAGPELPMESGVAHLAGLRFDLGTATPTVSAPSLTPAAKSKAAPAKAAPAEPAPAKAAPAEPAPVKAAPGDSEPAATPADPTPAAIEETTAPPDVDVEATIVSKPEPRNGAPAPEPAAPAEDEAGYDYLFGETMHRSVADAAVHVPDEAEAAASTPAAPDGIEHDGETVLTSDVQKLRRQRKPRGAAAAPKAEVAPRLVLAASPGGTREPLTEPLLVGRSPSVSKVSGGALPRLLTIGGLDQDISRNHVQFTLEGGTVVVTDLHSKNGTSIVLPGKGPQTLRAGEPTAVIVGTVIDLGGGVTFTVEEER